MKKLAWVIVTLLMLSMVVPTASATDPTNDWCEGVKIVFFPGGPAGGVFANNVYNGAMQAALDTGADVDYVFSIGILKK